MIKSNNEMMEKQQQCPEIPFFGAKYPDACCIDGLLYDLDSYDEEAGGMTSGGDVPCPFCKTEEFIEYDYFSMFDCFIGDLSEKDGFDYENSTNDEEEELYRVYGEKAKAEAREWYLNWIKKMREIYG